MTDQEKLKNVFDEIGVDHSLEDCPDVIREGGCGRQLMGAGKQISIPQGIGYRDFNAVFYFDENGKFLAHGVWE